VLGFCVNDYNNIDGFFYGSGTPITKRDGKGYPEIIFNSERSINAAEGVYRLVFETEGVFFTGPKYEDDVKNRTKFSEGTSMFLPGFFYTAEALREMKDDYGIVPFPLADENQENYSSIIHDILRIMFVPYNCQKYDAVCAVLEEMAFQGCQNVLPQYYDVLMKNKYARDDISASMIDIIRDSVFADVGYTMSFGSVAKIPRLLIQGKNSDFASQYASIIDAANAKIEDYIELFEDLK